MIPVGYAIPGEAAAFDAIKLIELIVDTVDELMDMDPTTTNFKLVDEISINDDDDDGQNNSSTKKVPVYSYSFDVIGLTDIVKKGRNKEMFYAPIPSRSEYV